MSTEIGSAYVLVLRYLAGLRCGGCEGRGSRGAGKPCGMCGGTGFKAGDVHLLVSGKQVSGGKR